MGWFKTKIRRADQLFSKYIRTRDKWHCVYKFKCQGIIDFTENPGGLQCSHFQKRRRESVRFDIENADSSCIPCHFHVENDPEGQKTLEAWKLNQLGERAYKNLLVRANQYKKKDDFMVICAIKALLKELE